MDMYFRNTNNSLTNFRFMDMQKKNNYKTRKKNICDKLI